MSNPTTLAPLAHAKTSCAVIHAENSVRLAYAAQETLRILECQMLGGEYVAPGTRDALVALRACSDARIRMARAMLLDARDAVC